MLLVKQTQEKELKTCFNSDCGKRKHSFCKLRAFHYRQELFQVNKFKSTGSTNNQPTLERQRHACCLGPEPVQNLTEPGCP